MKKQILKKLIFISFCITINILNVKAIEVETIPAEGFSINTNQATANALNMQLVFPEEDVLDPLYQVIFVNSADDPRPDLNNYIDPENPGCIIKGDYVGSGVGKFNQVNKENGLITISNDWYMANGYNYAYIVENILDEEANFLCKITETPIEVAKPELPNINERYFIKYAEDGKSISLYPNFPIETDSAVPFIGDHKVITKIGEVADEDLINSVLNNEDGAYETLLDYAKSNEGVTWDNILASSSLPNIDLNALDITPEKYYYVYNTLENTNNLYRDLDGITLAKGFEKELSSQEPSNTPSEVTSSNTSDEEKIENPKTGAQPLIVLAITVFASLGIGIYATKAQNQQF